MRLHTAIVAVDGEVLVIPDGSAFMQYMCSVLYCYLWPLWLYHIFQHYLIEGTIFWKKKIFKMECVLILSTTFV